MGCPNEPLKAPQLVVTESIRGLRFNEIWRNRCTLTSWTHPPTHNLTAFAGSKTSPLSWWRRFRHEQLAVSSQTKMFMFLVGSWPQSPAKAWRIPSPPVSYKWCSAISAGVSRCQRPCTFAWRGAACGRDLFAAVQFPQSIPMSGSILFGQPSPRWNIARAVWIHLGETMFMADCSLREFSS